MEQGTVLDRRKCRDRRMGGVSTYTGPERRQLKDRRTCRDRRMEGDSTYTGPERRQLKDRRTWRDRRMGGVSTYTGPERRKLKDRRSGRATVCINCGKVCDDQRGWAQGSLSRESAAENLIDICTGCSLKQVPKLFPW
jgi:hypothetical protein